MLYDTDIFLFEMINSRIRGPMFDTIMPVLTELGSGVFIFCIALVIFILLRRASAAGILIMAGLTMEHYTVVFLKNHFARSRPFWAIEGVNNLVSATGFSFPSGHATVAFMTAFILISFFGRKFFFISCALIVAVSRIYLGVHYPSDVAAGAVLGTVIGYILMYFFGYAGYGVTDIGKGPARKSMHP